MIRQMHSFIFIGQVKISEITEIKETTEITEQSNCIIYHWK